MTTEHTGGSAWMTSHLDALSASGTRMQVLQPEAPLARDAPFATLRNAYRGIARLIHPDKVLANCLPTASQLQLPSNCLPTACQLPANCLPTGCLRSVGRLPRALACF